MCKITRHEFCVQVAARNRRLPPDLTDRCSEYQKLVAEARTGDFMAQKRLEAHLSCEFLSVLIYDSNNESNGCADSTKWARVEKIHVSQVMPDGTCVPDSTQMRWKHSKGDDSTDPW